jgi:hypothetical protein
MELGIMENFMAKEKLQKITKQKLYIGIRESK